MGFGDDGEDVEIHIPTAGSSTASLHKSTSGKRDPGGSAEARTEVACTHDVRIVGVAEGNGFCGADVAGANRALRYGMTVSDRTSFTWALEFGLEDDQAAASMKFDSLDSTVSSAGT